MPAARSVPGTDVLFGTRGLDELVNHTPIATAAKVRLD